MILENAWMKESTLAPPGQRDCVTGCKRGCGQAGGSSFRSGGAERLDSGLVGADGIGPRYRTKRAGCCGSLLNLGGTAKKSLRPFTLGAEFFCPQNFPQFRKEGTHMKETIEALRQSFEKELQAAQNSDAVEKLRVAYLGKKGSVTELLKGLKAVAGDQKKEMGQLINQLKRQVEEGISQQVEAIRAAEEEALIASAEQYDVTLPVDQSEGSYHPITLVQRQLEEIFSSMGFTIEDYKEIVTDYECFEAVNIPKHHPARDMQDTYYLDNGQLLKTHTSAAQNAIMKKYGAPLRAVFPGRCFRNEATDACHENTFFQMEGLMIDKNISISNLIYFMKTMLSEVFERDITVRLRPGFFPFVEPGFELDISCLICGGEGCPSCKNSGWLELCPCGMIHPNVLKMGGIDPEEYTGFAFGLGLTRLAMMKYGIKDIRDLNSGNLKALSQFKHE
jgi:phenylalanyl-tRNA synthetase alpha chain